MTPEDLCDAVLELVGSRAEAETSAREGRYALTRFANSVIHQNVAEDNRFVRVRVVSEGRQAAASTNRVDTEGLTRLVESALEAARLRPPDPDWPGLAPPAPVSPVDHYDDDTRFAPPESRAAVVQAFVASAPDLLGAGYCDSGGFDVCFANSAGQRALARYSHTAVDGVHRTATSDGAGWQTADTLREIDGAAAGDAAAAAARSGESGAIDIEPGEYEVVLGPRCVADIVGFLGAYGFNAKAHAESRSFVRVGERQLDASLGLFDDVADPRALGIPFDAEGTPKRRVDLVRAGTVEGLLHDRRTARLAGTESTGHAIVGGESFGPMASNLFLEGLGAQSIDQVVGGVERGLYVSDFWYTRVIDPKSLVVTGLTRNGTFLIENGAVTKAISNLRFTQSYADALAPGAVLGTGDDGRLVDSSTFVPSLRLAAWRFTGGARG
ncbi:MAG TPA: TldD/PmbA family protein [Acidimicrobiales bacterium]|nr:TldD/PmbA family protein [Acidimicrobiales bacterium]